MNVTCRDCRYWVENTEGFTFGDGYGHTYEGPQCRRYPQGVAAPADYWCGEWQAHASPPPDPPPDPPHVST